MKVSETLIIELLKQGDENAYKYIYDNHYVLLCHIANKYVEDIFIAETIVSDLIHHLWEIRTSLDISASIRSYLVQAVRNRCINYLNLEYRKKEVSLSSLSFDNKYILSDNYPLGILLERELEYEIRKAIDKLPAESKKVFEKSRFENKRYEEIALELNISVNTVKYHIKNALLELRKELGKYLLILFLIFLL